jgi:hypothetical protein
MTPHTHTRCPHCGQPLPIARLGIAMSSLKARIFDAIARGGGGGIPCEALYELIFAGRDSSRETMKTHVWQLNELITNAGRRIVSDRHSYRLVTTNTRGGNAR